MDDIKILHVTPKVVDGVLSQLTTKYRKVSLLSVSRGHIHDYLNMRLDYSTKGRVWITMPKHIKGILEAVVEDMNGMAKTPAANPPFTVQEYSGTLTCVKADLFLTPVEKILFVRCWSRNHLKTALYFLTT